MVDAKTAKAKWTRRMRGFQTVLTCGTRPLYDSPDAPLTPKTIGWVTRIGTHFGEDGKRLRRERVEWHAYRAVPGETRGVLLDVETTLREAKWIVEYDTASRGALPAREATLLCESTKAEFARRHPRSEAS